MLYKWDFTLKIMLMVAKKAGVSGERKAWYPFAKPTRKGGKADGADQSAAGGGGTRQPAKGKIIEEEAM